MLPFLCSPLHTQNIKGDLTFRNAISRWTQFDKRLQQFFMRVHDIFNAKLSYFCS
jgi:hypothetical protein